MFTAPLEPSATMEMSAFDKSNADLDVEEQGSSQGGKVEAPPPAVQSDERQSASGLEVSVDGKCGRR